MTVQTGVLLMAYGTAPSTDDHTIRTFLSHILRFYRGAASREEDVVHLRHRLESVGGSPRRRFAR